MRLHHLAPLAGFALVLGACSVESGPGGESVGSTDQAVTKVCGAATNAPVQGYDVSYYQGSFNWAAAKSNGVDFGFARISDGLGFMDPKFAPNWAAMKSAGVLRGAYQFFEPGQDATAQANLVVQTLGKLGDGDLPAMIDVEATGGQSPATVAAKVKTWLTIVEKGTGRRPFIYSGSYFWQDNVQDTSLGAYPFWIAAYGVSCPSLPPGWSNWTFWQYSDGGGSLDHDVFNGTLAQLQAFAKDPDAAPRGVLDAADCTQIAGWAQDEDTPTKSIDVHLYFDGPAGKSTTARALTADGTRQDLCKAIGSCDHGFAIPPPRALRDDKPHEVYAYGIDTNPAGNNPLLTNAPKTFTCAPEPLPPKMVRRWITSGAVLDAWKFDRLEIGVYPDAAIAALPKVENAPATPSLAQGDDGAPEVWVLDGARKRHVVDPTSLAAWRFDAKTIVKMPAAKLAAMTTGPAWPKEPILVRAEGGPEVDVLDVDETTATAPQGPPGTQAGPAPADGGLDGCNASGGTPSLWLASALALVVARRRRYAPRR